MVLAGSRQSDSEKLIKELQDTIAKLRNVDKRVERLESLENAHERHLTMEGCVTFEDYDEGADTVFRVDRTSSCLPNYCYSHMTIWWAIKCSTDVDLWLQLNGHTAGNYDYAWSYTKGGATTDAGVANATALHIGKAYSGTPNESAFGRIEFPHFRRTTRKWAYGEWTAYDSDAESGSEVQRGNWGGYYTVAGVMLNRADIFATGSANMTGYVYLYGWCPNITAGGGPED